MTFCFSILKDFLIGGFKKQDIFLIMILTNHFFS